MSSHTPSLDHILRPRVVAELLGLSLTTLWRMQRRGDLPRPIQISRGAVGWRESTIRAYLASRERAA